MTWVLTERAKNIEPIPGIPWRDMPDAEFTKVAKDYAERGGFPPRSLHDSGFWVHIRPEKQQEE